MEDPGERLAAERAAVAELRSRVHRLSDQLEGLRARPVVRLALVADRAWRRAQPLTARTTGRIRQAAGRTALAADAVVRRRHLPAPVGVGAPVAPGDLALVHRLEAGDDRDRVVADAARSGRLVVLVDSGVEPLDDAAVERLVAAVGDDVGAAGAVLVHPRRHWSRATPHDGLVRSAGFALVVDGGAPAARPLCPGGAVDPSDPAHDVDGASAALLVVDPVAVVGAGGLPDLDDPDALGVVLGARLRRRGKRTVVVPSARAVDRRPVRDRRALIDPLPALERPWTDAVTSDGPALVRAAGRDDPWPSVAITVAAPSARVARRWGDWHLGRGLADALERAGHRVVLATADRVGDPAVRSCDVHVVVRGLAAVEPSAGQHQVLWIVSHPEDVDPLECERADLVLVASHPFADEVRDRTTTPVEVMLQATDGHRFRPGPARPGLDHPVLFVGKTRGVPRPIVVEAVAAGLPVTVYGGGWAGLLPADVVAADHVANEALPDLYRSAGVVLNDHWSTMRAWGFVSNRLFDVVACGTPVVSDAVAGVRELFDGAVVTCDPADVGAVVRAELAGGAARRCVAEASARVLARHTFDHRAAELLEHLARHDLTDGASPRMLPGRAPSAAGGSQHA